MRDSKIEFLRIYLAFMIVAIHVLSQGEHFTTIEVWRTSSLPFPFVILRCLSSVAVNTFMFISGWYGIKFSIKGMMNLYYQGLFYSLLSTIVLITLGNMSWGGYYRFFLSDNQRPMVVPK